MKKDYQIWNILHDGVLVDFQGNVPGELRIKVEIEYLANKLRGGFNHIFVILKHCSLFEYERQLTMDEVHIYKSSRELEGISPSLIVVSCNEEEDYLVIWDICGSIKTRYDSAELLLEDGNPLSFNELDYSSKEYWDNFGVKSNT